MGNEEVELNVIVISLLRQKSEQPVEERQAAVTESRPFERAVFRPLVTRHLRGDEAQQGVLVSRSSLGLHPPEKKSKKDTCNFDKEFTKMPVELTPTDKLFIMNLDQNEFQGFSYTNPEFVIQV
ncbi:protein kinase C beta type isoform X2 [Arapaima gigas]